MLEPLITRCWAPGIRMIRIKLTLAIGNSRAGRNVISRRILLNEAPFIQSRLSQGKDFSDYSISLKFLNVNKYIKYFKNMTP